MRHGQGSFTWANGDVYEGEWKEDVCDGKGVLITANGDKYEGEFRMGVKEGQGRKVWTNGDVYEGSWRGGQQDGHGTFLMGDGCASSDAMHLNVVSRLRDCRLIAARFTMSTLLTFAICAGRITAASM
jgi:hypothetical protein